MQTDIEAGGRRCSRAMKTDREEDKLAGRDVGRFTDIRTGKQAGRDAGWQASR